MWLKKIKILVEGGTPAGDILVLTRGRVIGEPIYDELIRLDVSVRSYYTEKEIDNPEAQEHFAFLKLLVSHDDRVALRWLLGVGKSKSYKRLQEYCTEGNLNPWATLLQMESGSVNLPYTSSLIKEFTSIREELNRLQVIVDDRGIGGVVDELFPKDNQNFREMQELSLAILEENKGMSLAGFVQELTATIVKPEIPSEIADVRIMSLHKSKGLSAPVTIIAGCVDGLLPKRPDRSLKQAEQDALIEEERRLFFVGITRVKSDPLKKKPGTLLLTYSQSMPVASAMNAGIKAANHSYGTAQLHASGFINELGPAAPRPKVG